jgi:hypothetical protein
LKENERPIIEESLVEGNFKQIERKIKEEILDDASSCSANTPCDDLSFESDGEETEQIKD